MKAAPSKPHAPWPATRRWGMVCAVIWLVALLVRLGHLWLLRDHLLGQVLMGDAARYHAWGAEIAAGAWIGTQTFYQAPLYPYLIGAVYWVFGVDQMTVRVVQAVMGATACVFLAWAGRRFFSPRAGLFAGAMLAVYPPAIFFDGIVQKTSLNSFLTCGLLAVTASLAARPRHPWRWGVLGVILGAWALTRENALVIAATLPFWLAVGWRRFPLRARLGWLICVGVGLGVALFPVALRNRLVGGEWLLTTSQFGPNFYIGNFEFATGRYVPLRQDRGGPQYEQIDATELAEKDLGRALSPGDVSAYWIEQTLGDIREDQGRWLRLMAHKWFLIWNSTEILDTEDIYSYADASWILRLLLPVWHLGTLCPLAVWGLAVAYSRWRRHGFLILFLLAYSLSVCLFYVFARYRFPLVLPLMLLAAAGLARLPAVVRRQRFPRLALGLVCGLLAGWFTNQPGEPKDPMRSNTHYVLAVTLEAAGAEERVIEREYAAAARFDPNYAEVYRSWANFEWSRGRTEQALAFYQRCLELDGWFLLARYDYALALMQLNQPAEALVHLRIIDEEESDLHDGLAQHLLGLAYLNTQDPEPAEKHFRAARAQGADDALLDRHLAKSLMGQHRHAEAVVVLKRAAHREPNHPLTETLLGDCCFKLNQKAQAVAHWREALKTLPPGSQDALRLRRNVRLYVPASPSPLRRQRSRPPNAPSRG